MKYTTEKFAKKKIIVIVLAIIIYHIVWLGFYLIARPVIIHNGIAEIHEQRLTYIKPRNAKLIDSYSKVGLLIGNGNHCDILTIGIYEYTGQKSDIIKFYKQILNNNEFCFFSDEEQSMKELAKRLPANAYQQVVSKLSLVGDGSYYITYDIDSLPANGDIRCY